MNDILKLEMLMIEVTTLKCKIEIFQYSMYMWWHEGDLLFLDILLYSKWNYSNCLDFAFIFGNFRTCMFYIRNSGSCKLATSQTVY